MLCSTPHYFQGVLFYLFSAITVRIYPIFYLLIYWIYFSIELHQIIISQESILQCELSQGLISFFSRLLLLLLSRFGRVRLCATPQTAAHHAPPSLGFSRDTGVGCYFLLQCMKVKSESEVAQSLSDHMDCSPPGSSIHGIFQARVNF